LNILQVTKKKKLSGKTESTSSGKHKEQFYKHLWNTVSSGSIWRGHFINKKKDSTFYEEEATISPVKNKNGSLAGYVAVKRDVTEQMKQEEYLRQTQKLQAIVTLAEGIAHNFNNIIVGILGYLQVCIYEAPKGSKLQINLEHIEKSCKRAMNIVKQFMCFSRKGSYGKTPVQIGSLIKNVLLFIKDILPDTIEIKENIKEKTWMVLAHKTQLQDLMINLCNNAVYAMKEHGGTLEVTLTDIYIDNQSLYSGFTPGHYIKLTVKDTGTGMDSRVKERIFEPFFTTKKQEEGSGMGLAIVHGIVKGHNGEILVESEEGKGSSFHIFLPIIKNK
jgi:signal transduction histidine kinase